MVSPETIACMLIAVAVLVGAIRLARARRDWQTALTALLMLASALLLYLTLFPPLLSVGGETLVVATAETPTEIELAPRERLAALPEAPAIDQAERVPDLATALRRHQQVQRIRILGRGLTQRDRDASAGVPVDFTPPQAPSGLVRLDPPADAPAGSVFTLAGEVSGLGTGTVELLDPAERIVDRRVLHEDGSFSMGGSARTPGLATFTLRLRNADKAIVSDTPVPLRVVPERPLRVLLLGTPSPEAKYLRRWAEDSGIDLRSLLDTGGGVALGESGASLNTGSLREVDVVIIEDRSLQTLSQASRSALERAVAYGLGVVVRMTSPATRAERDDWRRLGLTVEAGAEIVTVSLPPIALESDFVPALEGPGHADVPADINAFDDPVPELGRWSIQTGSNVVAAVTDAEGANLSVWQQREQGRVALWTVANSFALVLNGQSDRYYQWWSDTVSAVSRPDRLFNADISPLPEVGQRVEICGLAGSNRVVGPDASEIKLRIDPASGAMGCAAYWPSVAGVHTIVSSSNDEPDEFPFLVHPAKAFEDMRKREIGEATMLWASKQGAGEAPALPERRGPTLPWLLAWLLVSSLLWYWERRQINRAA